MFLIFISASSPECPLPDVVWKHTQLIETVERLRHLLFSHPSSIVLHTVLHSDVLLESLQASLFILVCHSETPFSRCGHHISCERVDSNAFHITSNSAGRRTQAFHPWITQPGKVLLVQPCSKSVFNQDLSEVPFSSWLSSITITVSMETGGLKFSYL